MVDWWGIGMEWGRVGWEIIGNAGGRVFFGWDMELFGWRAGAVYLELSGGSVW